MNNYFFFRNSIIFIHCHLLSLSNKCRYNLLSVLDSFSRSSINFYQFYSYSSVKLLSFPVFIFVNFYQTLSSIPISKYVFLFKKFYFIISLPFLSYLTSKNAILFDHFLYICILFLSRNLVFIYLSYLSSFAKK